MGCPATHGSKGFRGVSIFSKKKDSAVTNIPRELSMPTLSNLNISRNHTPVHTASPGIYPPQQQQQHQYQQQQQYHQPQQQQQPQSYFGSPAQHQAGPAEVAAIQSWAGAGDNVQQPQPMPPVANPMGSMWSPAGGIKFGSGPSQPGGNSGAEGQNKAPQGTWNPNAGIKFG